MMISKQAAILTVGMTVLLGGAVAVAGLHGGNDSVSRGQTSLVVAVAAPDHTPNESPGVEHTPPLPETPPLPVRAPAGPDMDFVSADSDATIGARHKAVTAKPAAVRAEPSADSAMLYGFPAMRKMYVVAEEGDYAHIIDAESGASGWIEKSALASDMMTASAAKPAPVRKARAEIDDAPKPVRGIPKKKDYSPMLLGGGVDDVAVKRPPARKQTDFASFVRRGLGGH